jgi:hypothetical protein
MNKEKTELAENAAALKDNKVKLGEFGNKFSEGAEKPHNLKDALGKAGAVAGAAVGAAAIAIGKLEEALGAVGNDVNGGLTNLFRIVKYHLDALGAGA